MELIEIALTGRDIDHCDPNILNHANEHGRPGNQSRTNSARLYEIKSKNGIVVSTGFCKRGEYP